MARRVPFPVIGVSPQEPSVVDESANSHDTARPVDPTRLETVPDALVNVGWNLDLAHFA
jgi:hypothetical protein